MARSISGVSIILTSYNYGRFIGRAIDSARASDAPDLEIVIVDNASSDDSWDVIQAAAGQDPRIRAFRNETNIGMIGHHVRGLELASKPRVLFLSADDYLLPGHLARLVAAHTQYPDIDNFFTAYVHVDQNDQLIRFLGHVGHTRGSYFGGRNEFADLLTHDCYACTPTTLFDRAELLAHGGFDPDIICGDYDTYLRLAANGARFGFLNVAGVAVRIHAAEVTGEERYVATGKQFLEQLLLLERHLVASNLERIAGREQGIANLLIAKMHNLRKYPDVAGPILERAQPRVDAVIEQLNQSRKRHLAAARPSEPSISVILTVTDDADAMLRTLDSLQGQDYGNWDLVLVTNASTALLPLYLDRAAGIPIRTVDHGAARSEAVSLNDGITLAGGEIVTYAEAGGTWPPGHLERIARHFSSAHIEALIVPVDFVARQTDGTLHGTGEVARIAGFGGSAIANEAALVGEGVPIAGFAHRRSVVDRYGRFEESLPHLATAEFVMRLFSVVSVGLDDAMPVTVHRRIDRPVAALADPAGYVRALQAIYDARPADAPTGARRQLHLGRIASELHAIANDAPAHGVLSFARAARGIAE